MEAQSPMDLTYMKMLRAVALGYLGLGWWPGGGGGKGSGRASPPLRYWLFNGLWCIILILQFFYVKFNYNNLSMFELGHIYFIIIAFIVVGQRMTVAPTKSYGEVTTMFVSEMHLFHHRYKSDYAMKVYKQVNKICFIFSCIAATLGSVGPGVVPSANTVNNYRAGMYGSPASRPPNGTYEVIINFYLPFDYKTNFMGHLTVTVFNFALGYYGTAYLYYFDLLLSVIVFHTWGHLKILDHNLRNFPLPAARAQEGSSCAESPPWYTRAESTNVARLLKENMDHHIMVMNFVRKTSDAFGVMVCFYYAYHQVVDCIFLLEMTLMDVTKVGQYGLLSMVALQQLLQMSTIFELISLKSDTLSDAVYSVPWECMRASERKTLLVFLCNAQTPVSLKAGGMVPVGLRTAAAIIKTTFSFFLMLRTMAHK